jgi:hypothetical protein
MRHWRPPRVAGSRQCSLGGNAFPLLAPLRDGLGLVAERDRLEAERHPRGPHDGGVRGTRSKQQVRAAFKQVGRYRTTGKKKKVA